MKSLTLYFISGIFTSILLSACTEGVSVQSAKVPAVPLATHPVKEEETVDVSKLLKETPLPRFSYNSVSMRDPFRSLVASSIKSQKNIGSLPPLQRSQVSDLRLRGIIWGDYGPRAIVNTPDGKGYTVRIGTQLGPNHGVILQITQNKIVIEETVLNVFGEQKKRNLDMELYPQKEGS